MSKNEIDFSQIEEAPENVEFEVGDEVDIFIDHFTDLGVRVVINNKYFGLVYEDDIYKHLGTGMRTKGYIKKIRDDNKIDISLRKIGYGKVEDAKQKIMDKLKAKNGYLTLNDNSSPEKIKKELQMSKNTFKKAIGGLYKDKVIDITAKGIKVK
ncbi:MULTISPECIES: hypothetical protein [unclassified Halanaerobium]|uniref:hypothetical protein n=1 Tax=unclassified Halanaerobium TaxID=2641197 RepID=UPI000DF3DABE|nr:MULTISPECIES: hypothetical protein [unclassified Halanaerobium]RCW47778.1 hypothetical protein DFR78_11155 [Halanaerobium sp. MA284_MarDTE_T2]RCW81810.1 hypothetical protein DER71_12239 [Halanaerobium sp. DL-01]